MTTKETGALRDEIYDELRDNGLSQEMSESLATKVRDIISAGADRLRDLNLDTVACGTCDGFGYTRNLDGKPVADCPDCHDGKADQKAEESHFLVTSFDLKDELDKRVKDIIAASHTRKAGQVDYQALDECRTAGRDFLAGLEALDRLPRGLWDVDVKLEGSGVRLDITPAWSVSVKAPDLEVTS